jgi:hypothetical protein
MRTDDPRTILPRGCGYVLTVKGHIEAPLALTCSCIPRWDGLLLVCPTCGTVWQRWDENIWARPRR